MGPLKAIASCYLNMFTFSGRARRAEYWWFALFLFLVGLGLQGWLVVRMMNDASFMAMIGTEGGAELWFRQNPDMLRTLGFVMLGYVLFAWLPQLAVTVRRLHDTDRSGWYIFMPLVIYLLSVGIAFAITILTAGYGTMLALVLVTIAPLAASLWFLIVLCLPGTHGTNRFGPDPVPHRKRKPPAHPAFAQQLPDEDRAGLSAQRKAEISDYYRKHVLTSIQKA
jgi:uncharacterized membrane protein YhaH (DUF805 family)